MPPPSPILQHLKDSEARESGERVPRQVRSQTPQAPPPTEWVQAPPAVQAQGGLVRRRDELGQLLQVGAVGVTEGWFTPKCHAAWEPLEAAWEVRLTWWIRRPSELGVGGESTGQVILGVGRGDFALKLLRDWSSAHGLWGDPARESRWLGPDRPDQTQKGRYDINGTCSLTGQCPKTPKNT
ncbi:Uncharacterized protein SCF082_LOCUS825 [Durusdinium trenchii]|uniref:Uncharacterized protein n=1 Tax=Durusdinium trenchii TaxID=1381693 RepID=A0ABP0HA43_9DINO